MKILVVEDDREIRHSITTVLELEGMMALPPKTGLQLNRSYCMRPYLWL